MLFPFGLIFIYLHFSLTLVFRNLCTINVCRFQPISQEHEDMHVNLIESITALNIRLHVNTLSEILLVYLKKCFSWPLLPCIHTKPMQAAHTNPHTHTHTDTHTPLLCEALPRHLIHYFNNV